MAKSLLRTYLSLLMLILSALGFRAHSAEGIELLPDSSNFLKASVVIAEPGNKFYSNLGHVAIRMECPYHNLDYCFSFLTEEETLDIVRFFAGRSEGKIVAIETPTYLEEYVHEGRGVKQYPLNLTLHEMQRLWMLLDNDIVAPENRRFNFIQNNCTSSAIVSINNSMIEGDSIVFVWPEQAIGVKNAPGVRYITRKLPWMQLLCMMLLGTEGEKEWDNTCRMSPELLETVLKESYISNAGNMRPLLAGEEITLIDSKIEPEKPWFTPNLLFSVIIAIVVMVSVGQWRFGWKKVPAVMDAILLTAQTVMGLLLCFMTFQAGLFGKHGNWFLVPFNPLPAIIWLMWHKHRCWHSVYGMYAVVLWAFVVFGGILLSVCSFTTLLLVSIFATRATAKYLIMQPGCNLKVKTNKPIK